MVIEFTEAHQNGSAELYQNFCEYLDAQVSKAVLGQTLTTEMPSSGGSRAAAEVHEGVRRDILNADARRLAATLARDLVRPIVELNMGPQARYPKIELGLPDDSDVKVFAEIVAMLADRGLRVGQKTILDKLGIAEASEGEAVLGALAGARAPAGRLVEGCRASACYFRRRRRSLRVLRSARRRCFISSRMSS